MDINFLENQEQNTPQQVNMNNNTNTNSTNNELIMKLNQIHY